jgi:DNA-binding IclR family transcriptional regulator
MATPRNQSVLKAFAMLKCFRDPTEWLTSSELSRRAGLPEASGYRLIQTLEEIGAVVRGPRGRYRPGMLLVSLSQNVIVPDLLRDPAQRIAAELSERLNVTVHVGVLERGMVTYVVKTATPRSFVTNAVAGAQLEAYCSGLGKILLAALPPEQLDAILDDGELVALTPTTITDPADLREHLDQVRRQDFAVDDREFQLNQRCIAVPVRDDLGRVVAAISVTEAADDLTPDRQAFLRGELVAAAAAIGRKVCPSGPGLPAESRPRLRALFDDKQGLGAAA